MKHHKHHGHKHHEHKHHGHHSGGHSNPYPGLPSHRMKYGEGIYCYLNEGHEERSPHLEMNVNPKWRGM